jgi:hypothetical protein
MDTFIAALYEAVMARQEDTILVFYGDHLPSIALDEGVNITTSDFETEYIIISNYETPVAGKDRDIAAHHIFPIVMEMIGNDEGVMNRFHRVYREDPAFGTLLEALEYDVLYGERMAYDRTEYPSMTDMVMGSRPITVTDCYVAGEYLYVKGTNFTAYSVIALDGKREQETEYLDSFTLRVHLRNADEKLEKLECVTVRQISASNDQLSETPPFPLTEGTESLPPKILHEESTGTP